MIAKAVLSSDDAQRLIDRAAAAAKAAGRAMSIAVVDDSGHALALVRLDGAGKMTAGVALEKARTAALARVPSGALQARVQDDIALLRLTDYLPLGGGLPIIVNGDCAGAIGVSGGTVEQDVEIATAALAALD